MKRTVPEWVLALLITLVVIGTYLFSWYPLETLELKTYDLRARAAQPAPSSQVAIVAIDDASIQRIGRWPWPRGYVAEVIGILARQEAKVIGVDILYTEEDLNQGLAEIRTLKDKLEKEAAGQKTGQLSSLLDSLRDAEERLDNDAIFAAALQETKRVVLPLFFDLSPTADGTVKADRMPPYLKANTRDAAGISFPTAAQILPPIEPFAARSLGLGHINLQPDDDGAVRRELPFIAYQGKLYPSFALQVALKYLKVDLSRVGLDENSMTVGGSQFPLDERGRLLIAYGGSNAAATYSFFDVMNGKIAPSAFKNRIVLIGLTASGLGTAYVTPVNPSMTSVDIIAQVVGAILGNHAFSRPAWAFPAELAVMAGIGVFLALALPRMRAGRGAIVSAVVLMVWNGAAIGFFLTQGVWLKLVYPSILFIVGYAVIVSRRYLLTERKKELVEADSIETNKMLGLSFQGQGMLDIAFEKFRKCPVADPPVKELLYNLALDFERKRMFNKAAAVYDHILSAGDFKDVHERIEKMKVAEKTLMFGGRGSGRMDSTVLIDAAETKPTLGRYEILKELGRGAMGTVYLGRDPKINREVAIKTLRYEEIEPDLLADVKKRFFHEAEAAGRLSHPNIVTMYDAGEDYDVAYLAMELLTGHDLTEYCKKENLLPVDEVVRIVSQVADALDYAHKSGVVHRDIKPANIMRLDNGDIKVTDFGIARVVTSSRTQTGVVLGTPSYMSPEQITGSKVDGRSDIFSLGVVFFELLTGEKPFQGDSIATLMYNIARTPHPRARDLRPEVPEYCDMIIDVMLAKEPEHRYQLSSDISSDIAMARLNS